MQKIHNKKLPLVNIYKWTSLEVIELCEKLSGQKSKTSMISIPMLKFLRRLTYLFQWTWSISDRLAFVNFLLEKQVFDLSMNNFYDIFEVNSSDFNSLENYLQEYFSSILQKMKELNEENNTIDLLETF